MANKINKKELKSETDKNYKKSDLDILTQENDSLLKSLKKPGGSYWAA